MTNKVASQMSVAGFSGKDLQGKSDGMANMYIFGPNHPGDGHHVDVPATTMKGDANASLLSAYADSDDEMNAGGAPAQEITVLARAVMRF